MSWFRLLGKLSMVPLVASLILTTGCGGRRTRHDQDGGGSVPVPTSQTPGPGPVVVPAGDRTPVEVKQYTTLKGKVTFEGTPPKPSPIDTMGHKDTPYCMKGDLNDFTWRVDPNGGVANVVIWVAPAPGKYFPLPPADKKTWPDEVTVDQPFCAFEPHASVAYTQYWDGKKMVATGQKVMIVNDAMIAHNTKYEGDRRKVQGQSLTLEAKKDDKRQERTIDLPADNKTVVTLVCDFHKWMKGYIWSLDTPYAAVTKPDGTYEIKNVPAGTEVVIYAWQESTGFFGPGLNQGEKKTLKEGEDTMDFKVKGK